MPCFRPGMIDHVLGRDNYELAKSLLDAAALRHEALATNIANVETPGFKRVDLAPDFAVKLADYAARPDQANLERIVPKLAQDPHATAVRPDGNNIQVDRELLEMNRNSMEFEFLAQYASDSLKRLKTAITGRIQ